MIADLKKIYQAATVVEAEDALDDFAQAWDEKYLARNLSAIRPPYQIQETAPTEK